MAGTEAAPGFALALLTGGSAAGVARRAAHRRIQHGFLAFVGKGPGLQERKAHALGCRPHMGEEEGPRLGFGWRRGGGRGRGSGEVGESHT